MGLWRKCLPLQLQWPLPTTSSFLCCVLGDGNLIFKLLVGDYPFFGGHLSLVLGLVLLSCQFGGQLASFYTLLDFRLAVMTRTFVGLESTY